MSDNSLKDKTISALIWNATQRYGILLITFVSNIVLARLLTPEDYGVIGVLMVFITVSGTIVDSGFSAALIQKKTVTQTDWSTVFFWNIGISLIVYGILFLISGIIADYFSKPVLKPVLHLLGCVIVINSFSSIQNAKLSKELKFKTLAIRSIVGTSFGAIIGIILALKGFGFWSLVWQTISATIISVILLWTITNWRPSCLFSWISLKKMFRFGGYIFLSGIFEVVYSNFQSFVIGKFFSLRDLGFYSQAKKIERVPIEGTSSVLGQVLFPVYSFISHDYDRMKKMVRNNFNAITFITFPLMTFLIVLANPLFYIVLGEKWMSSVPMFQILCIFGMMTPLNKANSQIFRSLGDGRMYFTLQFTKQLIALVIMLCFISFGIFPFLWACAAVGFTSYGVNLYYTHKRFGYTYKEQLGDILPNFIVSAVTCLTGYFIINQLASLNHIIKLIIGIFVYVTIFGFLTYIFKLKGYKIVMNVISYGKPRTKSKSN